MVVVDIPQRPSVESPIPTMMSLPGAARILIAVASAPPTFKVA